MMSVWLFLLASFMAPAAQEPAVQSTTTVNVLVTDRRGIPLRSARVVVNGSEHVGVTNNSGRVVLTNVKTGEYTLRVERNQYITFEKDFDVRDETGPTPIVAAISPLASLPDRAPKARARKPVAARGLSR